MPYKKIHIAHKTYSGNFKIKSSMFNLTGNLSHICYLPILISNIIFRNGYQDLE